MDGWMRGWLTGLAVLYFGLFVLQVANQHSGYEIIISLLVAMACAGMAARR